MIKKLVFMLFICSSLQAAQLPSIQAPLPQLQEGTETRLTAAQIQEILPWAKNTKATLQELLFATESLSRSQKEMQLYNGITQAVLSSSPRHSEIYTRFILNRALKVYEVLRTESDAQTPGATDMRLRLLTSSIRFAIEYFEIDVPSGGSARSVTAKDFGVDYAHFLAELSKSYYDASAQYQIERLALGFLQWDLYRDLDNQKYAADILRINTQLETVLPTQSPTNDSDSVNYIRAIKRLRQSLEVLKETADNNKLGRDGRASIILSSESGNGAPLDTYYWASYVPAKDLGRNSFITYNNVIGRLIKKTQPNGSVEDYLDIEYLSVTYSSHDSEYLKPGAFSVRLNDQNGKLVLNSKHLVTNEHASTGSSGGYPVKGDYVLIKPSSSLSYAMHSTVESEPYTLIRVLSVGDKGSYDYSLNLMYFEVYGLPVLRSSQKMVRHVYEVFSLGLGREDKNFIVLTESQAREYLDFKRNKAQHIVAGKRALYGNQQVQILEVYSNNSAKIKFEDPNVSEKTMIVENTHSYSEKYGRKVLYLSKDCWFDLCSGMMALQIGSRDGSLVKVIAVYENGMALIEGTEQSGRKTVMRQTLVDASSLSAVVDTCYTSVSGRSKGVEFCRGQRIVHGRESGVILSITSSGSALVKFDSGHEGTINVNKNTGTVVGSTN